MYMKTKVSLFNKIMAFIMLVLMVTGILNYIMPTWVNAQEKEPEIVRVGYFYSHNVMEGMSDEEEKSGYAYEYLQKVSYYTNWEYEYVYGDWDEIINKFYNGEVDVLAGVSKSPDRVDKILFPDYPMGSEKYYIYVHKDSPLAGKDVSSLNGRDISVNRGSLMEEQLRSWQESCGYDINIVTFDGNEERLENFDSSSDGVTVDIDNTVSADDEMVPLVRVGGSDYYLAVAKNRPDLLAELNKVLGSIYSFDPDFTHTLSDKYFSNIAVNNQMSDNEKEWLASKNEIKIGYLNNYMPFSSKGENGEPQGVICDLMDEMMTQLGISKGLKLEYISYDDSKKMVDALKKDEIDIAFPVINDVSWAANNNICLSNEVISTQMNLVYAGDYSDLRLKKMAVKKGNEIAYDYLVKHYPDVEVVEYDTVDEALESVEAGKTDATIINELRKEGYLNNTRFKNLHVVILSDSSSRCIAVNHGNVALLTIINRGIVSLPKEYVITNTYKYAMRLADYTLDDFVHDYQSIIIIVILIVVATIIVLVRINSTMKQRRDFFDQMAHKDGMTELYNRRAFDEIMDGWHDKDVTKDTMIIAMDLNGLKKTNDTMGHEAGDELIIGAANCMSAVLGKYGKVFRIGGDEFAAILHLDPSKHYEVIRDLHVAFNNWQGEICDSLSVAVGACSGAELKGMKPGDMVTMADERLYIQKDLHHKMMRLNEKMPDQNHINIWKICNVSATPMLRLHLSFYKFR